MLDCKHLALKILSEEKMTLKEKMNYHFHLFLCRTCRLFTIQMENFDHSLISALKRKTYISEEKVQSHQKKVLQQLSQLMAKKDK